MRRFVVLHPLAAADATVLILSGLVALGSWLLLTWARAGDDGIAAADMGTVD